jgi:molecular chaperone DnaK (HSP70)
MSSARFVVGIDLGTTNSAVAFVDTQAASPAIETGAAGDAVGRGGRRRFVHCG